MIQLYVMRHAKSSWYDGNLIDHERPLSKKGKKDAKKVCEFFVKKRIYFDYLILSTSKRTKKTAKIIFSKIKKPKKIIITKKIYLKSENVILNLLKKIPFNYKKVLLINHDPAVKNLSKALIKNNNSNLFKLMNYKFPTGSFVKIIFKINNWKYIEKNGTIRDFIRPKDI